MLNHATADNVPPRIMLSYEGRNIKSGEATFWIMLNHATADNVAPPRIMLRMYGEVL